MFGLLWLKEAVRYCLTLREGQAMHGFLKKGLPDRADAFAAEAEGLEALRPHIRVPKVLERGVSAGKAYIRLEFLRLERSGDWAALGRMLAKLHRVPGPRFGWPRDNYIGLAPQINTWHDDWAAFFLECRLRPQAARAGIELPSLKLLEGHRPQ